MITNDFKLTRSEWDWFGDRMTETRSGRVTVPSHCYNKFRKIIDNEFLSNQHIKDWLIDNVYNSSTHEY